MSKIYVLMCNHQPIAAYASADLAARSSGWMMIEAGATSSAGAMSSLDYRIVVLDLQLEPVTSTFENAVDGAVTMSPQAAEALAILKSKHQENA